MQVDAAPIEDIFDQFNVTDSVDAPEGMCVKEGCGNPLPPHSGRGRKPKYCIEHRVTNRAQSGPRVNGAGDKTDKMVIRITGFYVQLAMGVKFVGYSTDAQIVLEASTALAESWRGMLGNPKVYARWDKLLSSSAGVSILMTHGMVVMAIMSAHNVNLMSMLSSKQEVIEVDNRDHTYDNLEDAYRAA